MSGPPASRLCLLSELRNCLPGQKVRFLGCVDEYDVKSATLRLKHHEPDSDAKVTAHVNVEHVLEFVKRDELDAGTWVNVIGHFEKCVGNSVFVQAVAVWDAGNVDIQHYEETVRARKKVE